MTETSAENPNNDQETPRAIICPDLPAGLPMFAVRLLIANNLGLDLPVGDEIIYSRKTGACVIGPQTDRRKEVQFGAQKEELLLIQALNGKLTHTARDRDTVSVVEITAIDKLTAQITAKIKGLLGRK